MRFSNRCNLLSMKNMCSKNMNDSSWQVGPIDKIILQKFLSHLYPMCAVLC